MGDMADYYGIEAETGLHVAENPRVWWTKDGMGLPYGQIENDHLLNILRMLRRQAVVRKQARILRAVSGSQPRTDHGADHFDMEIREMERQSWREHVHPQFIGLYQEALKRPVADEARAIYNDDQEREGAMAGLALLAKALS